MTATARYFTLALCSALWTVPALAQEPGDVAGASVLQVHDAPDQIISLTTRIRHTTVIQLPARENILDFVVGDSEYWHLTGAANLAFLKPIGEGVHTNVALVCESGRIYSFLVTERDAPPHLIVRVGAADDATAIGVGLPAFVARSRVAEYQLMAEQSREAMQRAQLEAEAQIAAMAQTAAAQVNDFRSDYPTRLQFPYKLEDKAARWPFLVQGMWHDGHFTYVRSTALAGASWRKPRTLKATTLGATHGRSNDSKECKRENGPRPSLDRVPRGPRVAGRRASPRTDRNRPGGPRDRRRHHHRTA